MWRRSAFLEPSGSNSFDPTPLAQLWRQGARRGVRSPHHRRQNCRSLRTHRQKPRARDRRDEVSPPRLLIALGPRKRRSPARKTWRGFYGPFLGGTWREKAPPNSLEKKKPRRGERGFFRRRPRGGKVMGGTITITEIAPPRADGARILSHGPTRRTFG